MANYHLVILKKPYIEAILDGRKCVESRFSTTKRDTFGQVLPGDIVLLKLSSGPVCGMAAVEAVKNFENLTPRQISKIKEQYNDYIQGTDEYWHSKSDCKFGFLVWLKDVRVIEPVQIRKRDWRAWVVLREKEDFGLLKILAEKTAHK
jgi:ASC-1-like (ASCH) protein